MNNRRAGLLSALAATLVACGGDDSGAKNKLPVAHLTATPPSGAAPLTVAVSGTASTDADGTIASYAWTFGDGSSASGATASHTYAAVGEYEITLTVTDDAGASGRATASVVATGPTAIYNGSTFDDAAYQDEPPSGTLDSTPLQ